VRILRWAALLAAVVAGCVLFLTVARPHHKFATLTWDYDYSRDPPCGTLRGGKHLQTKCVVGFNVFIREDQVRTQEQFLANEFDPSGKLVTKSIKATLPVHRYGHLEFCVTSVGKDQNGRLIESNLTCSKRWVFPLGTW
jgi:hypothetical protein